MRDLYEVFNDLNLEEEKDLEVMNDLEKQKWKKKLRKEIKKPVKTGRKVAVSAGCLGIAAGLFLLLADSEVLAVAKQAVEETYRSIAVWVGGTPEENDYVQEVYGKAEANGREITIVDMIVDEDLLQISYQDRDLSIENFLQGGYVGMNPAEETKDNTKYFLDAELLVDGKTAGSGAVSGFRLSSETNAINGNFCIYTGDFGVDMSKVKTAELTLRQRYVEAEEEWNFSLDLEKRNLKDTTKIQELSQVFSIEDGRTVEVYRYAENEGARKLYVKVTRPENWDPDKFYSGYLQFRGVTDQKQKVLFKAAAGDIYLLNRNINSNTKSITIIPEVIPRGEVGEAVPEEGIPIGESFTIQVNN